MCGENIIIERGKAEKYRKRERRESEAYRAV